MHEQMKRRTPTSIREYVDSMREAGRVYLWVWRDLVDDEARVWIRRMFIALTVMLIFNLAHPWFVSRIFDGLPIFDHSMVLMGAAGVLSVVLVKRGVNHLRKRYREWVLGLNMGSLDQRSTELFLGKSMGQHQQEGSELSASNVEKGRGRTSESEDIFIYQVFETVIALLVSLGFLWWLHWVAGAVMTLMLLVHIVWSLYLNQKIVEVCIPLDVEFRALMNYIRERWDQVIRVKVNAKEAEEVAEIRARFDKVIEKDRPFWMWAHKEGDKRGTLTELVSNGLLLYAVWLVWNGELQLGLLWPLWSWVSVMGERMYQLSEIEHRLNWNFASIASMMRALTMEPDVVDREDAIELEDGPLSLALENVTHRYLDGGKPVLRDVSLSVQQGEKVALIGLSGAGKTTVMRLALRFMDPAEGSVLVNGHDLRDVKLRSWLRRIGYIAQQPAVFDGTIRYNLLYGLSKEEQKKVTDEELWELVRLLQIDFGDRLTDGLDTKVGKYGMKLSGGEQQRLMIGAAAIKKPRMMIIDEATSSLDAITERKVHDGLHRVLTEGMSALIITHRLATVRDLCDKFIVMRPASECRDGRPQVEAVAGSFEELWRISPTFRLLCEHQGIQIA